tara:strand:+ start:267 stop:755 length:489 start_codon:yes stop_codon:yes gene_type:complete
MNDFLTGLFPSLFSNPQTLVTRPEVLEQMERQRMQPPVRQQGPTFFNIPGLFGIGNEGFITTSNNQPNTMQRGVSSVYDLETGQMREPQGVFTGDGKMPDTPGIFDALSNMSGEEAMGLANTLQGLLGPVEQPTIKPMSMPGASTGLRLPETDLMQFYKGLL